MVATGAAFATLTQLWPLVVVAFVGTLNPSNGDVSVFLPLEHAVLAARRRRSAPHRRLRALRARRHAGRRGRLAGRRPAGAACADAAARRCARRLQAMFGVYAAARRRSGDSLSTAAAHARIDRARQRAPLTRSRRAVFTLAALFSLDAFGGGFIVQSLIALWLYQRFDLSLATAGTIFFATGVLSALSYLVAVRVAKRIGLVNTMVFTHLPANVCLVAIPFVPGPRHRDRSLAGAQPALADGRADAKLVRDGDRLAGRAAGGGQPHRGSAQPRLGGQPVPGRLSSDRVARSAGLSSPPAPSRSRTTCCCSRCSGTCGRRRKQTERLRHNA